MNNNYACLSEAFYICNIFHLRTLFTQDILDKISSFLNCCDALSTILFNADAKLFLESHHNLNLKGM